jgi:wobble nucleotide-excising tRNase
MIRRIQRIMSFGVFDDFQWSPGLPEFKQYNLIYGWNYSGKTTLSRILQCFEKKQVHADFASASAELVDAAGNQHDFSTFGTAPSILVFNSDFVRGNLGFETGSASPILVLGAQDIAKEARLKQVTAEAEKLAAKRVADERDLGTKKSALDHALTNYARDHIKNAFSVVNYDRRKFEPRVEACKSNPEVSLLKDDELHACIATYRSKDKRESLSNINTTLTTTTTLVAEAASLLGRVVSGGRPIQRLKDNPEVERWVRDGRQLHSGKDTCQFCDQLLPPDLLSHLSNHFSADYDSLMASLTRLVKAIESACNEKPILPHKNDLYPELVDRYDSLAAQLGKGLSIRSDALKQLLTALEGKKTKVFSALDVPTITDGDRQINAVVAQLNEMVSSHNRRTDEFETERGKALERLEQHYAALFAVEQKYTERLAEIEGLQSAISADGSQLDEYTREIRGLERALSEAVRGAERINELLAAYFGKNDLRVVLSKEGRYQITRGGHIAKNLSEGEKTAIAFAYFITRVQDGRQPMDQMRIVVDDPVSSLDASHLFNTYALVKTQLARCKQLFLLTHSFEFYNLLREWLADTEETKKQQSDWKKWSAYLTKRGDNGKSALLEIPKELLKFKSEYHYLFSVLYRYDKNSANFDSLLNLPNMVRRFMEAFGGIMIPTYTGLKGKMSRLFKDEVTRERVWKFINYYSHNTTIMRSLTIPDTSECEAVVRACIQAVRDWDLEYFQDLEAEIA